jgi:transposase
MPEQVVGIDVSARHFDVSIELDGRIDEGRFPNTPDGHAKLVRKLTKRGRTARVALEATGIYHLDLAMALQEAGLLVAVVNPRAMVHFAEAMSRRAKTDPIDAAVARQYASRMELEPWKAPAVERLKLRSLVRRIQRNKQMAIQERGRLHAARSSYRAATPLIVDDLTAHVAYLEQANEKLLAQAQRLVEADERLREDFRLLQSIRGIGKLSAILVLGELALFPADTTPRQWVALAGLDPRVAQSGQSTGKRGRISRRENPYLRAALYMPAVVAVQFEPAIRAYYQRLVSRGKPKMVALVAVMRKLLHAAHGMLRLRQPFDGDRFFQPPIEESTAA